MSAVVPWINRSEFESVCNGLFSGDNSQQKRATARISTWKSRCVLPVAVDSTAALFNVIIRHFDGIKSGQNLGESLRNAYSLAIIRFVNHITERSQVKLKIQPVHILARELGVPEWIVNLRHDATHGKLPSMDLLKTATDFCIQWLKDEYWDKQLQGMASQKEKLPSESDSKARTSLENLLRQFSNSKKGKTKKRQQQKKILYPIENMILSNRKSSVQTLTDVLKEEMTKCIDQEDVLSIWDPVFNIYHQCGLTLSVLRCLPITDNYHSIISTFLYHLADCGDKEKIVEYMDCLLRYPDSYNVLQLFGKLDLQYLLPEHKAQLLEKVTDIHTSDNSLNIDADTIEIHHIHDLNHGDHSRLKSEWKVLKETNWDTVPLGSFSDFPVTYNSLRLRCNGLDTELDDGTGDSSSDHMEVEEYLEEVKESGDTESVKQTWSLLDVEKIQNLIEIF